jgi:outer membrane protein assembly factor BamB
LKRPVVAAFVALVVLATVGAATAVWFLTHRGAKVVRGSPTVEFIPTPPADEVKKVARGAPPWPTYGRDPARTHVADGFEHRPPFRRRWMVRLGFYIEFPPVVGYDRVFAAQLKGRVVSIDARSGKVLWRRNFRRYCVAASPALGKGTVYVAFVPRPCNYGSRDRPGFIVALRVPGGFERWRFSGPASETSPLLVKGTLYFGSWDHGLYALDVRRKKPRLRWVFRADGELNSSPAYAGDTIYIGSTAGSVYAVNARTGRLRWRSQAFSHFPRGREDFYATPTIAYGRVYIGNTDGTVYAYGARTGRLLWARPVGTYVYTAAAVWHRKVYVGTYDGYFLALDAATGDVVWRHDSRGSIHGAPTVMDGLVYFAICGTCGQKGSRYAELGPRRTYALDARNGRLVWTFPDGHYSPVVADRERVYLAGSTRLYALEARTRARRASQTR